MILPLPLDDAFESETLVFAKEFIRCFEYIVVFTIMVNLQLYLPRADPEQNESAKRGLVERLVLLAEDPGERQHVQLHIRLPRLRRRGQELLVKGAACLIPSWRVGLGRQSEMLNIKHFAFWDYT